MKHRARTRYLFDRVSVATLLGAHPAVAAKLANAADRDTLPSQAFAGFDTNPRQLYRVFAAAPVYPWLAQLVDSLESCIRAGWYWNRVKTSDRQQFRGVLAELHVAEHFLLRGVLEIEREPFAGGDLRVVVDDEEVLVEVTAPIELAGLNDFFETVRDVLKHLDEPYDFRGCVALEQLDTFGEDGRLVYLNPITLAKQLPQAGVVAEIAADTAERIGAGEPFRITQDVPELNLRVVADFADISRSAEAPAREIMLSLPTLSGYAPEALFNNILRKTRKKAREQQAGAGGARSPRLLVVDLSTGEIASELRNAGYRARFERMFSERLGSLVGGEYDGVALVEPRGWGEGLVLLQLLFEDQVMDRDLVERLFETSVTAT